MFGKLMSISDELMWRYYTLLTDLTPDRDRRARGSAVDERRAASEAGEGRSGDDDRARTSTAREDAAQAAEDFERRFAQKELPVDCRERPMLDGTTIEHLLLEKRLVAAARGIDERRAAKMQQGGVRINGEKFTSVGLGRSDGTFLLQVGRQILRIVVLAGLTWRRCRARRVRRGS